MTSSISASAEWLDRCRNRLPFLIHHLFRGVAELFRNREMEIDSQRA